MHGKSAPDSRAVRIGPSLMLQAQDSSIVLSGSLTVGRDKLGLALAQTLCSAIEDINTQRTPPIGMPKTKPLVAFAPFADDVTALTLSELTIENHKTQICLWGKLEIVGSEDSNEKLVTLLELARSIIAVLRALPELPDFLDPEDPGSINRVNNPFA